MSVVFFGANTRQCIPSDALGSEAHLHVPHSELIPDPACSRYGEMCCKDSNLYPITRFTSALECDGGTGSQLGHTRERQFWQNEQVQSLEVVRIGFCEDRILCR